MVVRLSHPASMELVLRKRLCFSVVKRHSLAEKLKRKLGQVTIWMIMIMMMSVMVNMIMINMSVIVNI